MPEYVLDAQDIAKNKTEKVPALVKIRKRNLNK